MPTKYEPLQSHLRSIPSTVQEVSMTFHEIERILGASLPESATAHRAWWSNQKNSKIRPQAYAWLSAGFLVDAVSQGRTNGSVRFKRHAQLRHAVLLGVPKSASVGESSITRPSLTRDRTRREAESRGYHVEPISTVYLVSCVSSKRTSLVPAKYLYISDWFQKARAYVESSGMPWFILSAQYGLLAPNECTVPYEKTLNTMSAREREGWADMVIEQMRARLPDAERVVVLAGERYRQHLLGYLGERFSTVETPLRGLRIGEQLHWFSERIKNGTA